jgi:hypothetical protein
MKHFKTFGPNQMASRAVSVYAFQTNQSESEEKATIVRADKSALKRRQQITAKFLSGEWGVELAGYEELRVADRKSSVSRTNAWRK